MPRLKTRDPRKRFASLYRFIDTDLTDQNWREMLERAARVMTLPPKADRPLRQRARIFRWRCSARWPGLAHDVDDLAAARAIQERFRRELATIKRGDSSPAHTSVSRLLDHRFDRLKRILTVPPLYVEEVEKGGVRALSLRAFVYRETVKRECPRCGRPAKQYTCGVRKCVTFADNTRRGRR